MNDLEELRAFRDEVRTPDHEHLARGRARLVRATAERRRVPVRRLAIAGAAAAAVGAGVVVALPDGGGVPGGTPPTLATRPMSATAFLERAATTVEKQADQRPGDHQWVYTKVFHARKNQDVRNPTVRQESWIRFDGLKTARYRPDGKLRIQDEDWVRNNEDSEERTPAQWYDYLGALPRDPAELVAKMRKRAREYDQEMGGSGYAMGTDQWVFRRLSGFLSNEPSMPRSGRAAVYRALGKLPGVKVRENAKDALGRPGVAVTRTGKTGVRDEVVVTTGSYRYLGRRLVATRKLTFPAPKDGPDIHPGPVPAGTVMIDNALEASAIVDRPGRRP